ncbi:MAG: aminoglycoside phosphotransferase family protein, partial [Actinomycetota bacterium]|nr:aminoglycoside phosphotransferase family protein [Actinomycetota bacterium]
MVVRAWPERAGGRARVETIHVWLREAAGLSFLPLPIPGLDGRTAQELGGRCWEVTPWLPGEPETNRPPAVDRVRAAFQAMAILHQRLARGSASGPSLGLNARREELARLIHGGFEVIGRAIANRSDDPLAPSAAAWLDLARRLAPGMLVELEDVRRLVVPLQPCLRDARPEHFLFQGNVVSGLVDFGAMDVDTVAGDLARLLG